MISRRTLLGTAVSVPLVGQARSAPEDAAPAGSSRVIPCLVELCCRDGTLQYQPAEALFELRGSSAADISLIGSVSFTAPYDLVVVGANLKFELAGLEMSVPVWDKSPFSVEARSAVTVAGKESRRA